MRRRKLLAERQPHVFHVSAGAMDQHDGGLGAWAARRKPELGHVQPHAVDQDEMSGRRMRGLDARNPEHRHRHEQAEHNDK